MTKILDGSTVAMTLLEKVRLATEDLKVKNISPKLVVIVVGEDPASQVYVRHKEKACAKTGILSERIALPESVSEETLIEHIVSLNLDESVHGIIVQLPLPKHIHSGRVIKAIDPKKDVDGFHAYNFGKTALGAEFEDLAPCTPKGIIYMLNHYNISIDGLDAVVIGRSNIVGKPISLMLLNRGATVSVCHSRTKNLLKYTKDADLIVLAIGKANFLKSDMIKEGALIIDVGINRLGSGNLCGDADFDDLLGKAGAISPVPGGVGPMTVACLLANTVTATLKQAKIESPHLT